MGTNLNQVKKVSKELFDVISFEDAMIELDGEPSELFLAHPFTNCGISFDTETHQPLNLVHDKEAAKRFRDITFKLIDKADSVIRIRLLLNKSYLLFWFKLIRHYLSEEDYATLLKDIWISSENPNQDVNVSLKEALSFFQDCNNKYLMDNKEKQFFNKIPEYITLYRGVSRNRNPYGLSYTYDQDKAVWFQNRFKQNADDNYLITLNVKKEDCVCYINARDEKEVIVDVYQYLDKIREQIPNKIKEPSDV